MPAKPRFVFDTNAVISAALLKKSISRRAFDKALEEGQLLLSLETIDELDRVLRRGDFAKYVTDKDLLVLHPFRGISIVTPRDFLDKAY